MVSIIFIKSAFILILLNVPLAQQNTLRKLGILSFCPSSETLFCNENDLRSILKLKLIKRTSIHYTNLFDHTEENLDFKILKFLFKKLYPEDGIYESNVLVQINFID